MVQTAGVVLVYVIGRPDDAVAPGSKSSEAMCFPVGGVKAIVCVDLILIVTVTSVAAKYATPLAVRPPACEAVIIQSPGPTKLTKLVGGFAVSVQTELVVLL